MKSCSFEIITLFRFKKLDEKNEIAAYIERNPNKERNEINGSTLDIVFKYTNNPTKHFCCKYLRGRQNSR